MAPEFAPVALQPSSAAAPVDGLSNLYQQIVESAHEGIWIHDLTGRTTYANAQMGDLLGYSVDEMELVTLFDVLDDDGKRQAAGMLDRERVTPLNEQVDCRYVRKDRSTVWCLVSRSPLLDHDGRHIGSINLVSDITERKQLDEALRRTGVELAEAQRTAHLGSWAWDVVRDDIEWSDELYEILGLVRTPTQVTYDHYLAQVHPDDLEAVKEVVLASVETGAEVDYECRIVRPGGQVVWIHAQGESTTDSTGAVLTMRGTVLDITAYKTAVQEVQRTSSRYRLLQRMATEANRDSGFEHVIGLALEEILTYTRWPFGRVYLVDGDPPQLAPTPLALKQLSAASEQPEECQLADNDRWPTTRLPDRVLTTGEAVWVTSAADGRPAAPTPTRRRTGGAGFAFPVTVDGEVVAVLEFLSERPAARDEEVLETCEQVGHQLSRVVQRRRAADDLAAARDAAMESLRVKSEFLATMSHEIRTPMNGVIGLTNLLLDTPLNGQQRQYAEGVQVSGEALLTVINDILDFSKLEAGKVELECEEFDVRQIVKDVAALLDPAAYTKKLELLAYCLPDVPAVLSGDSGRIRQVLLNLVSNGVKFAETGEVVTKVTSAPLGDGVVTLRFEVRDTGIGIAERSRDRLFESFSQADTSTTRRYGGTGLGLAISQRLVEAMGGTIGFTSEVGVGSVFWFELPLTVGARPELAPGGQSDLLTGLRVLVVDDDPEERTVLESQLASWQLRPGVADSASAALLELRLAAAQGEPYALATLDRCLPDMDGLELARRISADDELAGLRMVMLAPASELEPAKMLEAGITEWLLRPAPRADLYDRLHRLMAPPRPGRDVARRADPADPETDVASLGRVLVVEDNPLNQLVAQGVVTSLGYSVDVVDDGAEALTWIGRTTYVAVLMDCHMPVLDGYQATREIRRREGGSQHLPIIAMTAGAMADDRDRCVEAGMDDFVSKPVALAAVRSALSRWATPLPVVASEDGAAAQERVEPVGQDTVTDGPATVVPSWEAEPVLDPSRIAQLRQLGSMGGNDLLGRISGLFSRDRRSDLDTLRQATVSGSVADLLAALHKLKGASSNIGANRVAALCARLEHDAQEGITASTRAGVELLGEELERADRAITQAVGPRAAEVRRDAESSRLPAEPPRAN